MPKNKDSIALPKELAKAIAKEAANRDLYQYEIVQEAWGYYSEARKIPAPAAPPDPHEDALSAARAMLKRGGEDTKTMEDAIFGAAAWILSRSRSKK